jgi:hypothetical protein
MNDQMGFEDMKPRSRCPACGREYEHPPGFVVVCDHVGSSDPTTVVTVPVAQMGTRTHTRDGF